MKSVFFEVNWLEIYTTFFLRQLNLQRFCALSEKKICSISSFFVLSWYDQRNLSYWRRMSESFRKSFHRSKKASFFSKIQKIHKKLLIKYMKTGNEYLLSDKFDVYMLIPCQLSSNISRKAIRCTLPRKNMNLPYFIRTVWSSDLYTLLMRYEVNLTPYRIKSVYKSLDQTVRMK